MKPAKQAAPEVSDRYVFRSGKAEGSSSKLQVWEVQKITYYRTKVRRGKSDRQPAGEIPELAKYLTLSHRLPNITRSRAEAYPENPEFEVLVSIPD
ncbi:hypothetical protein Q5692_27370 [Microcoleus sp. C2C3]|uniref:hypothetical protein n=1 Tax=unclassified Microcoleus TaxID=2642155 RepID=UPI002FD5C229